MVAFKRRGIMVLALMVFIGVVAVEALRPAFGWESTLFSRAGIAVSVAVLSALILRHFGFQPFAKNPDQ